MLELAQDYEPRTFWQVLWDAIRKVFVQVAYTIIDGIAVILKEIVYGLVYR